MFNVLATATEFEADLVRARTREGMAVAKARGKLRGRTYDDSPPPSASALHKNDGPRVSGLVGRRVPCGLWVRRFAEA
ncbi:recombinase family protein [Streptomyces sp. NPDC002596]